MADGRGGRYPLSTIACIGQREHTVTPGVKHCTRCGLIIGKSRTGGPGGIKARVRLRSGGLCEVRKWCNGRPMVSIHHIWKVEWGGEWVWDNLLAVCGSCHMEIHRNEDRARRLGLLATAREFPLLGQTFS